MSDLRDPLLDDLETMFRRREGDVGTAARLSSSARRAVRRRQALVSTTGVVAGLAVLVLVLALAGAGVLRRTPPPLDSTPAPGSPETITSTFEGATITWPSWWTMLQLEVATSTQTNPADGEPFAFRPLFQLSNFDPGLGGWICPLGSGQLQDGQALLYVQAVNRAIVPEGSWPVEPPAETLDRGVEPSICQVGFHAVAWSAAGVTYEAYLYGEGADYERLLETFGTMTFADGVAPVANQVDGTPLTGFEPSYVLASEPAPDSQWNVLAVQGSQFGSSDACMLVSAGATMSDPMCQRWTPYDGIAVDSAPVGDTDVLVGGPPARDAVRIDVWPDDGDATAAQTLVVPASLGGGSAFVAVVPKGTTGSIAITGSDGVTLARFAEPDLSKVVISRGAIVASGQDAYAWWVFAYPRDPDLIQILVTGGPQGSRVEGSRIVWEGAVPAAPLLPDGSLNAVNIDLTWVAPDRVEPGRSLMTIALLPDATRYVMKELDGTGIRSDRVAAPQLFHELTPQGLPLEMYVSVNEGTGVGPPVVVSALDQNQQVLATARLGET